ncbi:hypothetical protein BDR05DRAFT_1029583, partial [Suillus weaverae]
ECSVSVYAPKKGRKGVDDNDLWYGIIECFRVDNRPKALQPFWVKIRWYWSNDLEEDSFKSASQSDSRFFSMGSHELLQSDLTQWSEASILADIIKVVKFDENSGFQKPWSWDGLYTRCCPVERGIKAGVSGNGWAMSQIDTKWIIPTKQLASTIYYQCPICPTY